MNPATLPAWAQRIVTAIAAIGSPGLFAIAFLDSTVLPLPSVSDFLMIDFSIRNPVRMPIYALLSTLGSLAGCLAWYFVARKGGELFFRKHAGARADRIHQWVTRNGFVTMTAGALTPPPTPFKLIVIGAGAFNMPLRTFVVALLIARAVRFFVEGILAVEYGEAAAQYVVAHKVVAGAILLGAVLVIYLISRLFTGERSAA
jgi:membrane protein YqaA with SNARE-associated domain